MIRVLIIVPDVLFSIFSNERPGHTTELSNCKPLAEGSRWAVVFFLVFGLAASSESSKMLTSHLRDGKPLDSLEDVL